MNDMFLILRQLTRKCGRGNENVNALFGKKSILRNCT
jgi:hypothetical protein